VAPRPDGPGPAEGDRILGAHADPAGAGHSGLASDARGRIAGVLLSPDSDPVRRAGLEECGVRRFAAVGEAFYASVAARNPVSAASRER
jgi:hypothetical protein